MNYLFPSVIHVYISKILKPVVVFCLICRCCFVSVCFFCRFVGVVYFHFYTFLFQQNVDRKNELQYEKEVRIMFV